MAKPTGFMEFNREVPQTKVPSERINDFNEIYLDFSEEKLHQQAARCMDCGVPFCHSGCPLGNIIPDFNDMAYRQNWESAYKILSSTNNFPEFTGRICPAPCENSCVLSIGHESTTIELIEKNIIEKAFELDIVKAQKPKFRTGKRVAVVGSGPAGLAAAAQLNKAGHWVVVFERADQIGGLLRYGIPDFKLEKKVIERRMKIMREEGIAFKTGAYVGKNVDVEFLTNDFDAIVLTCGSTVPRTLNVPGSDLKGVYPAMDFLTQQNRRNANLPINEEELFATDKNVLVIGGGDTGADCVGTSNRHRAASITQIELLPKPADARKPNNPWPQWANVLRTSSSHLEGCYRLWSVGTKEFLGDENGNLRAVKIVDLEWTDAPRPTFKEVEGSEREVPCQLALLAVGFMHTEPTLPQLLGVDLDERGNIKANNYQTNVDKIFAAGDARRGQSLVVWAISEGREAARAIDQYLMGSSSLESKNKSMCCSAK